MSFSFPAAFSKKPCTCRSECAVNVIESIINYNVLTSHPSAPVLASLTLHDCDCERITSKRVHSLWGITKCGKTWKFNSITARKRSLPRLCFYTCLSFCSQEGLHPGWKVYVQGEGSASRERALYPKGVCIQNGGVCIGEGVGRAPIRYYGIQSTSGRYASYWNAVLLLRILIDFSNDGQTKRVFFRISVQVCFHFPIPINPLTQCGRFKVRGWQDCASCIYEWVSL